MLVVGFIMSLENQPLLFGESKTTQGLKTVPLPCCRFLPLEEAQAPLLQLCPSCSGVPVPLHDYLLLSESGTENQEYLTEVSGMLAENQNPASWGLWASFVLGVGNWRGATAVTQGGG